MTRILVTAASYIFSDHLVSSEGLFCYSLFKKLQDYNYEFDIITPFADVKKPLDNVNVFQTGTSIISRTNDLGKYNIHLNFYSKSPLFSKKLLNKNRYDAIHHILPSIFGQTFSPLILLKDIKTPILFGPVSYIMQRPFDERLLFPITKFLHLQTLKKCAKVVTISEMARNVYDNLLPREKLTIIPFAVERKIFTVKESDQEKKCFEILAVGSLIKIKGFEYLIMALPKILKARKNVVLRIIGEGVERTRLEGLARDLGVRDKIVFEGFVPHDKMPEYFQNSDVFCLPSLGEPFGKAIIEAMSCGKPIVSTRLGGPSEIIKDGYNGYLIPARNHNMIASALIYLMNHPDKRIEIGRNARKTVEEKYSWDKISQEYHKLYQELILTH